MFLPGLCGADGARDPLLLLLLALALDAALGDLPALYRAIPHPVVLIGRIIAAAERKLNREKRSRADRILRGGAVVAALVLSALALGWAVERLRCAFAWGWVAQVVLAWTLIAQRSLFDHVRAVYSSLENDGLEGGRKAVSHIVGRDPEALDAYGIARAAIESCAENFSDAVVAPVFWYVALGMPGLLAYKVVNTLDSMIGHRDERHEAFGKAAARLDDVMNVIPARLSGFLLVLAGFLTPSVNPYAALRIMLRDAGNHRSPNSGWPEAAMAGALDLTLAGPRAYPTHVVHDKWIGEGRSRATPNDIRRALKLFAVACLLLAGGLTLYLWGAGRLVPPWR